MVLRCAILSFFVFLGCNASKEGKKTPIKPNEFGITLRTSKGGAPYIVHDFQPELSYYNSLTETSRKEYLDQRIDDLIKSALAEKKEYFGKKNFVVKFVLIKSLDEYQKPDWSKAKTMFEKDIVID